MLKWGKVKSTSNDKGPYRLVEVEAEGKTIMAVVANSGGAISNPTVGSMALVLLPGGEDGRAAVIPMHPPRKRRDKMREGEEGIFNCLTEALFLFDADGNCVLTVPKDWNVTITGKGNITIKGDLALTVQGKADITVQGAANLTANGAVAIKGATVDLN